MPAAGVSFDLSLGGLFIGVILNVLLYGFSCVQIYLYQARFKNDDWKIKALAYSMFTFDTANSIFDCIFLYRLLVTNFGDLVAANTSDIWFALDPVMTGLIAFMCQAFFAWRVHRLTHTWWIPAIIILAGGASFLSAIGTTIGVTIVVFYDQLQRIRSVVIIWLTGAAIADVTITSALIYTLNKSRTGFPVTDDVLTRLIRVTLQTGLLTSTFAVVDLILYLSSTSTLHLVFNLPLAKLYCNTFLSSLNARAMIPTTTAFSSEMHTTQHSVFQPGASGHRHHSTTSRRRHLHSHGDAEDLESESRRELGAGEMSKTSLALRAESAHSLGYHERPALAGSASDADLLRQQQLLQQQRGVVLAEDEKAGGPGSEGGSPVSFTLMRQQYAQQQQQQQQQLPQQQVHAPVPPQSPSSPGADGGRGVHVHTISERYVS